MNNIDSISISNLSYSLIPVGVVLIILVKWNLKTKQACYAMLRMVFQLLLVGYCLNTIFASNSAYFTLGILAFMLFISSWIALNTVKQQRKKFLFSTVASLLIASAFTLAIVVLGVLELTPWYQPRYTIPLGGMILANSMNSISLAAERFQSEVHIGKDIFKARNIAFNAALIPTINTLLAVGLVSLPGMMTGQILSGISPFIAVRYQIMVMCMLFASSGISTACFLTLIKKQYE